MGFFVFLIKKVIVVEENSITSIKSVFYFHHLSLFYT